MISEPLKMWNTVSAWVYANPVYVWVGLGVSVLFYNFVWPVLKQWLDERSQQQAARDYAEEVRVARLKQADALRDATKMAEADARRAEKKDAKPKPAAKSTKKPASLSRPPPGSGGGFFPGFGGGGGGGGGGYRPPKRGIGRLPRGGGG